MAIPLSRSPTIMVNMCSVNAITMHSLVILTILEFFVLKTTANDILGCGGFIKSHVNLDFSKVEIKLFTKQGSLKEKTECAPTNGYYFLPLYEPGEYVLKVDPPPGWSIEPSEIPLNVDGVNDACSKGQDLNFAFTGFGITGRVITIGSKVGPAGVSIHLISEKGDVRETTTKFNGDFHFTPVIPGKYTVKAYHHKWKLNPSSTVVQVSGGNTELRSGSLAVQGYDVTGTVTSNGKPISGIHVLLYPTKGNNPKVKLEGCNTAMLQGIDESPICFVASENNGKFSFGLVPIGDYYITPLEKNPGQSKTVYNIQPNKIEFKVEHGSVDLKNTFEVTGFSVSGRIINHLGGAGISGAEVLLDRRFVTVTDADGRYTLSNLKPNTYTVQVIADGCEFDDATITITPGGTGVVADVWPARWKVCGAIRSPDANSKRRSVLVQSLSPPATSGHTAKADDNGEWCLFLPSGNYMANVQVSEADRRDGLQFFPLSQKISVGYKTVEGIIFSQLKATLTGSIKCMKDSQQTNCLNAAITLRPLSLDGSYTGQPLTTNSKDGKYVFNEILPGSYEVSVASESLCWSSPKHNIAVTSTEAVIPEFVQTGYAASFTMSHKSQVTYTSGANKGMLDVPAGISQHCLPSAGEYVFTPTGCHKFDPPTFTYDTRQPNNMVVIVAVSHAVGISVLSSENVNDLKLKISGETIEEVGPLKPLPQKQDGLYVYLHTLMLPQGSTVLVTPLSGNLLFSPPGSRLLSVAGGDCVDVGLLITATKGKVLEGRVNPPIEGVVVNLEGGEKPLTQTTDKDGKYRFGPLDATVTYQLNAEKESYVITGPDSGGNFQAQKLAEIIVKVIDSNNNEPLQSALVSVSGGSSYRRNLQTGNDGRLYFPSLAPGEYYLKPLMKEYKFSPPHRIISVKEGETHEVTLSGIRVACSGVGEVVTLGGGGLGGVTIAAEPAPTADPSRCPPEEAIAERENGAFRIRGLIKGCLYRLTLKAPVDMGIAHVIPSHIDLEVVSEAEDIEGLKFIAVQPMLVTDVNVLVYTPKVEHYKTLKLRLTTEVEPTSSIYSTKMDASGFAPGINPGMMLTMPRLPADNRTYLIILESTLSKSAHIYNIEPIYFASDAKFKHFRIDFEPKVKVSEQELNQPSVMILPFLALAIIIYMNREKVLEIVLAFFGSLSEKISNAASQSKQNSAKMNQYTLDDNQIDQIVQNINAVRKRPKPRKI